MFHPNDSSPESHDDLYEALKQLKASTDQARSPREVKLALSASQADVVARLETLYKLRLRNAPVGGIKVRTHALLAGPSGSGKTTAVRFFATRHALPLITISFGQWSIWNAKSDRYTLDQVGEFIRTKSCGVIFIDELDKATSRFSREQFWTSSATQELFALLDGDERLETANFSGQDRERLGRCFLIVAAGAWQQHWNEAAQAGGGSQDYVARIMQDSDLPDELFYRFAEPLLPIMPPSEQELGEFVHRIRSSVDASPLEKAELKKVVRAAAQSGRAMRFVENYASQLAAATLEEIPLAKFLENVPPVERGRDNAPMGESKAEAQRRLFAELRSCGTKMDESAHAIIQTLPKLDPSAWLPLYRALSIHSLGDPIIESFRFSKREIDELPSAIQLEARISELDANRISLQTELKNALSKIGTAAVSYSSVGEASTRKAHEHVLLFFGAWVSAQIKELLCGPQAGEIPHDLLFQLEDFSRRYLQWHRTYTQLLVLLS